MPTQSLRRVRTRRMWFLAGLASLLAVTSFGVTPGADAVDPAIPLSVPKGGKVIPPKTGTWVGTYEEASGSQIVTQTGLCDLVVLLGRPVDVAHNYTGWKEPFPGWREKWDVAHGRVPFVSWA